MADERVEGAVKNWLPRLLAHGVDYNDFVRVTSSIERWEDWLDAWVEGGAEHEALAREAEVGGRLRTAGEAYTRAAVYYHFGKSLWLEDVRKYRATTERSVAAHRRGMPLLDPTFERLEIPLDRDRIVANLRKPPGLDKPPVVVLVPGLDSVKEEFPSWEETFLRRGMATISLDGPGQGEAGFVNRIRPDYEVPVRTLLDTVEGRGDLDLQRVGITGLGMGGYYATRATAFEPRITAAGVVGGPYEFPRMPPLVRAKFMHAAQIDTEERAGQYAASFTLEGVVGRIKRPYLVAHGARDAVMPWEQAERTAKEAPSGEFLLYPDGNTVCQSVNHKLRPYLADWLKEKIG